MSWQPQQRRHTKRSRLRHAQTTKFCDRHPEHPQKFLGLEHRSSYQAHSWLVWFSSLTRSVLATFWLETTSLISDQKSITFGRSERWSEMVTSVEKPQPAISDHHKSRRLHQSDASHVQCSARASITVTLRILRCERSRGTKLTMISVVVERHDLHSWVVLANRRPEVISYEIGLSARHTFCSVRFRTLKRVCASLKGDVVKSVPRDVDAGETQEDQAALRRYSSSNDLLYCARLLQ